MRHRMRVALKRAYEVPEPQDGIRVLVDRLWPRGASKERAHIDLWLKEVAPSDALRRWYGHDPSRFVEFRRRFQAELAAGEGHAGIERLRELSRKGPVTLVFAARDVEHSNATILRDLLQETSAS